MALVLVKRTKHKTMSKAIMLVCFSLLMMTAGAQGNGRVRSGTPLRWTMKDGSIEIMEGDLVQQYGTNDTANKRQQMITTARKTNPLSRVSSGRAVCDQNSVVFNWVGIQQPGVARYELEQSADEGVTWHAIGTVPANREELGKASYSFRYNNKQDKVVFRINAISTNGEAVPGTLIASPCHVNSYRAISPNPVFSTTNLQIGASGAEKVKLLLVNNSGVVMQTRELGLLRGTNQVPVDMSTLPQGYYTLFIQWNGGRQDVFKLVKQ
jgi:hypothetical protein